jgi:O-acetyl-ADP-ribose deacetylase (regulator of RNase III)
MTSHQESKMDIIEGDITKIEVDAIVNAANSELRAGGGVCGAIYRAAGHEKLAKACAAIGGCPTGSAVITPAFDMPKAKHIIHAVGPIYQHHPKPVARDLLRSAYKSAIELAVKNDCKSIAFPAISTGIYGYPLDDACKEAVDVCLALAKDTGLKIRLVAFDGKTSACLRKHYQSKRA